MSANRVCLSVQVEPRTRDLVREIAKQLPGTTIHAVHRALLDYAAELAAQDPSIIASRLVRY